ncbi:MAG: exodeoxyribonuclease V subunit alpha [Actinomycetales bacterium]|nr:MAG: exodeoxyribonuclease V subunit alpha [Actinomycetales bacterium]
MTEQPLPLEPHDVRRSVAGTGMLAELNALGLLETPDVHVAERLGHLAGEPDLLARLALALAVRELRTGSVSLALDTLDDATQHAARASAQAHGIPWPSPEDWLVAVRGSRLVEASVLQVEHGLVYLDRYWREETAVAEHMRQRLRQSPPQVDETRLESAAQRIFPPGFEEQRRAGTAAARRWVSLVTGGPGTGKTTAVAGLLALLADAADAAGAPSPRIALAAPTGKAAARLQEAVARATAQLPEADRSRLGELPAQTVHRLLGWRPNSTRFRHHRGNRLRHDIVVVDETSMMSLTLMARLLEAVRPDTRLVLVGDPDQLSSVEAGAVLADLVIGLARLDDDAVTRLRTAHRFGAGIGSLAAAVRDGDADRALEVLHSETDGVRLLDPQHPATTDTIREQALSSALAMRAAAEAGDPARALAALDAHRLLCAHREGPYGAGHWNRLVEHWLGDATGFGVGPGWGRQWYAGRPIIVTENDYGLGLYNGDTGVAVSRTEPEGGPGIPAGSPSSSTASTARQLQVVIATAGAPLRLATSRLTSVATMHALTIHKSQGSQAAEVTIVLPPPESPLLTRELFYTAITRAQRQVRVIASDDAVRQAVLRPARRASGLRQRLTADGP